MVSKISNFILVGIIFTTGNSANGLDSNEDPYYYKNLENIVKRDNYHGILNHPKYRPRNHYEDISKIAYNKPRKIVESENESGFLKMLNDLDKTLKLNGNDELKKGCYGSSCEENRDDYNRNSGREHSGNSDSNYNIINEKYDRHMRCNGKSCSIDRDDDRSDRNSPRCYGNKCSRQPYENDYSDDRYDENGFYKDITRNRLSSDDDGRDAIDSFRCTGDKCYRNINVNNARDNLRCIGEQCSRYSANDRDRDRIERYDAKDDGYAVRNGRYDRKNDISNDRDGLRCDGYRCDNRKGNGEKDTNDQDQDAFRTRTRSHKSKPSNKHKPFILDMVVRKDIKNILGKLEKKKMQIDEDNAEKRNGLFKTYLYDMRDQMLDLLDFHYGHGDKEVARKWLNFWLE